MWHSRKLGFVLLVVVVVIATIASRPSAAPIAGAEVLNGLSGIAAVAALATPGCNGVQGASCVRQVDNDGGCSDWPCCIYPRPDCGPMREPPAAGVPTYESAPLGDCVVFNGPPIQTCIWTSCLGSVVCGAGSCTPSPYFDDWWASTQPSARSVGECLPYT
jgi:hypothetical protein